MVSEKMDMLGREEAEPAPVDVEGLEEPLRVGTQAIRKISLIQEVASNGEAILTLRDGGVIEAHADDTHFYPRRGVLFKEEDDPEGEEAESWYFAEDIISVQRH